MKTQNYRHWDICFIQKEIKTEWLKKLASKSFVAQTWNTTGHTHIINGDIEVYEKGTNQVLVVNWTATITHPEHKPLSFPSGTWGIIRENEWDYFGKSARKVID